MKKGRLKEIVAELQGASKMHLKQSKEIAEHIDDMSPVKMNSPLNFKGANSSNSKCWPGFTKVGVKDSPSGTGETVNDCKKSPAKMTDKQYNKKNTKMRKDHNKPLSNQQTSGTGSARVKFAARFGGQGHSMTDEDGSPSGYAHALKRWGFSSGAEATAFANKNKESNA